MGEHRNCAGRVQREKVVSSWDQSRLLGGGDVGAGAGRIRKILVSRDGREEDFMGRAP